MKVAKSAGTIALALTLSACAAQQPPAAPPLRIVSEAAPKAAATPPPPTGAQLLAEQPPEVQQALKEHRDDGKWPVYRTRERVLYPYDEGPEPIVDCAPLRTTDIQLEPGETITDVAMGDTERWMATPAASGDPRNPVPHLAVKPQLPGIETNLTIYTTKHIYHLVLRSRRRAMQEVEFYYPDELLAAMKKADAAAARAWRPAGRGRWRWASQTRDSGIQARMASASTAAAPRRPKAQRQASGPNRAALQLKSRLARAEPTRNMPCRSALVSPRRLGCHASFR